MTTMRARIARKLIDIDPCISGYHPVHLELKYPIIDAVLAELANQSVAMVAEAEKALWGAVNNDEPGGMRAAFKSAIRAAKDGK